jgi:hypothetical protein
MNEGLKRDRIDKSTPGAAPKAFVIRERACGEFVCRKLEPGDGCCSGNSSISIFADSSSWKWFITSERARRASCWSFELEGEGEGGF